MDIDIDANSTDRTFRCYIDGTVIVGGVHPGNHVCIIQSSIISHQSSQQVQAKKQDKAKAKLIMKIL